MYLFTYLLINLFGYGHMHQAGYIHRIVDIPVKSWSDDWPRSRVWFLLSKTNLSGTLVPEQAKEPRRGQVKAWRLISYNCTSAQAEQLRKLILDDAKAHGYAKAIVPRKERWAMPR
jgi:hypothetical protein